MRQHVPSALSLIGEHCCSGETGPIPSVLLVQVASLRRCTKITNVGLAALTLSGSLRSFNISGIAAVGPALMKALADSCS